MGQYSYLYKTARWKHRRARQLREYPLCKICLDRDNRVTAATVVDHLYKHNGNIFEFFNGAVQSLCKRCHDSVKQSEERLGYSKLVGIDGWPAHRKNEKK